MKIQSITILFCLILAVTILSVQMHPHGVQYGRRPSSGNGTVHSNRNFASSNNHTEHHNGFRPQHGYKGDNNVRQGKHRGDSGHP